MTAVEQLPLLPDPEPQQRDIPDAVVFMQPTSRAALQLAMSASGLDHGDVAKQMGVDKGTWSRILAGQGNFPIDDIDKLNGIVRNTIYLRWINHRCGHEGRPLLTTIEQQLHAEHEHVRQLEHDNELMRELLAGRVRR